jgi:hypothetical protein
METSQFTFSFNKKKVTASAGKFCLPALGLSGNTVRSFSKALSKGEFYVVLRSSVEAPDEIRRKRPHQLARGALLHHDNARPHTILAAQERI